MRKEVPLHRLGKPQNQNCKGLASGRRCQIRTASLVPKTSVLPLHHILYGVAMRPRLRSQYRSDLSGDAQISLNTALEQLSFNRWLWVGHWGQRPDLNWNFEGMNLVCFHYTTLRYVRHFVRMPQTGQKRIGGSKCLSSYLAGMTGFEPANVGVKVPCLTTWRHPNVCGRSRVVLAVGFEPTRFPL